MLHSQLKTANCAHKKVGMARYPKWHCLVDSFRDQRFSLETWIVYLFGIKINGFKPSSEDWVVYFKEEKIMLELSLM